MKEDLKGFELPEEKAEELTDQIMNNYPEDIIQKYYQEATSKFRPATIVKGIITGAYGEEVYVDIGYKIDGVVPRSEFRDHSEITVGRVIDVYIEQLEDETGNMVLSKSKADKLIGWEKIITHNKEGDVLEGIVIKNLKNGLLVDVNGVPVFMPASQIDLRKVEDLSEFIGHSVKCSIVKIDKERMNIIVSRKKYLEDELREKRQRIFSVLKEGSIVKGVVKGFQEYGAFIDIGGLQVLLPNADISWRRIFHPGEVLKIGQEITVKVIKIDREQEKLAVSLKHLTEDVWRHVPKKYAPGKIVKGKVISLQPFGAIVRLEPEVEGIVHISEISWTKKISDPAEVLKVGQTVDVVVIDIDMENHEIALSIKQTQPNPWAIFEKKYPTGSIISGKVSEIREFGALIDIGDGIEGLLHLSDMSWGRKITDPTEFVEVGQTITLRVLDINVPRRRIALGLKQLRPNPWEKEIPEKYKVGTIVKGVVTRVEQFGAFVRLEPDIEGLLHVSRAAEYMKDLKPGINVEVRVVRLDPVEARIRLSLVRILPEV
jgi:small subunit ribosomal protein S1